MDITAKSIFAKLAALAMVAGMLALSTVVSVSGNTLTKPLGEWFAAIQKGDAETLDRIVADNATIELRDLGITQTKAEFIESLNQWVELNSGATILTRQVADGEGEVVLEVCYRFASNEVQNRETFMIADEKITASLQEKTADSCSGF